MKAMQQGSLDLGTHLGTKEVDGPAPGRRGLLLPGALRAVFLEVSRVGHQRRPPWLPLQLLLLLPLLLQLLCLRQPLVLLF